MGGLRFYLWNQNRGGVKQLGGARRGTAELGQARLGREIIVAWLSRARPDRAGKSWRRSARQGKAGHGLVWRGLEFGVWHGEVRSGKAWPGVAWHGEARKSRRGTLRLGAARRGKAWNPMLAETLMWGHFV